MGRISVTENGILMSQARESLRQKWGLTIGAWIVFFLVIGFAQVLPFVGPLLSIVISGPMSLGWAAFVLVLSRGENPRFELIFDGFQRFGTALAVYLLVGIFVFLWSLLLIVPGIIAGLAYAQAFFVLADNRSMSALDILRKSKEMMRGNKWKLFCMGLRFVGWALLCILTLGIGFLWLIPYVAVSAAKFYDDIRDDASAGGLAMPVPPPQPPPQQIH
jgi:uncharacterized membrane protein